MKRHPNNSPEVESETGKGGAIASQTRATSALTETERNQFRWKILETKLREQNIEAVFRFFRRHEIEPILIKGWAVERFYPERLRRVSADVDLAVAPHDFERAEELLKKGSDVSASVDLHRGLRHLDSLPFDDLFANSRLIPLNETDVRILRPEDHLRVLCVHWLTDGGAYRHRLWDIYFAVANRPPDFDWERFLKTVDETRRHWLVCTIAVARRYLDLDVSDTPIAEEITGLPVWFVETIEKEWIDEVSLTDIRQSAQNGKILWKQIRKRFPPNAIHASVMCGAPFDDSPRLPYQISNFFSRLTFSIRKSYFPQK